LCLGTVQQVPRWYSTRIGTVQHGTTGPMYIVSQVHSIHRGNVISVRELCGTIVLYIVPMGRGAIGQYSQEGYLEFRIALGEGI
jgi:hypothetical protein